MGLFGRGFWNERWNSFSGDTCFKWIHCVLNQMNSFARKECNRLTTELVPCEQRQELNASGLLITMLFLNLSIWYAYTCETRDRSLNIHLKHIPSSSISPAGRSIQKQCKASIWARMYREAVFVDNCWIALSHGRQNALHSLNKKGFRSLRFQFQVIHVSGEVIVFKPNEFCRSKGMQALENHKRGLVWRCLDVDVEVVSCVPHEATWLEARLPVMSDGIHVIGGMAMIRLHCV